MSWLILHDQVFGSAQKFTLNLTFIHKKQATSYISTQQNLK